VTCAEERPRVGGFGALLGGDQATLARALSVLERGGAQADSLAARLRPHTGSALVVGFTGPPGAGKSTLISAYIAELRRAGEPVAVLAVDPSSPVSGGAVLGDRTRMNAHSADPRVFIRSVSSRGQPGGLARSVPAFIDALDAAGWPVIVLETVGTGQTDAEALAFADVGILLSAPGMGDDIQAIKAGLQEVADILVVNKCDLPGADRTAQQLSRMLGLRGPEAPRPPVISTSSVTDQGVAELATTVRSLGEATDRGGRARRLRCAVLRSVEAEFMARLASLDRSLLDRLCAQILVGEATLPDVVDSLLEHLRSPTTP
jgi:LAO/AO transport system kinase